MKTRKYLYWIVPLVMLTAILLPHGAAVSATRVQADSPPSFGGDFSEARPDEITPLPPVNEGRPVELRLDTLPDSLAAPGLVDSPASPDAAVSLVLDDGQHETAYGVNSTDFANQFIWLNRFTPSTSDFPFTLNEIRVMFDDFGGAVGVDVGDAIDLIVYQDSDGDPTNGATWQATFTETVQAVDGTTWSVYNLSTPVALYGPGDVLIAVIDRYVNSGVTAKTYPAAIDTTGGQDRSWIGWWTTDPPDPAILPPDDTLDLMTDTAAGNWMIRGYGETGVIDETGPVIGTPSYASFTPITQSVTITANISDQTMGDHGVLSATLRYGYSAPYDQYSVSGSGPGGNGDGDWSFIIPAQGATHEGQTLYFSLEACDNDASPACSTNDNSGNYFPVLIANINPNAAAFPFYDGFESGALDVVWSEYVTEEGRVQVSSDYPYYDTYSLLLDDSVDNATFSHAAAILTIDLNGQSNVELEFWWQGFDDENDAEDGVFISDDNGANWHQVVSFDGETSGWHKEIVDIDAEAAVNGLTLNDHFQIKFQFYDNYSIALDGYSIDQVYVQPSPYRLFLPVLFNDAGPPTSAPVLNPIDNPDGDYDYDISWTAVDKATNYTLEQDDNADFTSSTTVYSGAATSTSITGQDLGTYYYRVKASNVFGESDWSNIESVTVTVEKPPCPQTGSWSGTTNQGYPISFTVSDTPSCQTKSLQIKYHYTCTSGWGTVTVTFYTSQTISNGHFDTGGSNPRVEGDFTSQTAANGTWSCSFYDPFAGSCYGSGTWTAAYTP